MRWVESAGFDQRLAAFRAERLRLSGRVISMCRLCLGQVLAEAQPQNNTANGKAEPFRTEGGEPPVESCAFN